MALFPEAKFLFFSDDPDWVVSEWMGENCASAGRNDELVDLFALSECDHQIIANSTFSWWAAWLNRNEAKTVVTPARWFQDGFALAVDEEELLPSDWIRLST
ncbi:MAG: hypothetical protein Fues2KO_26280 [Fuerstiella sp.]